MGLLRENFGRRIRQLRKARDWTQEILATRAGMEYKYLGAIERGEKNLTIDNIEKIAAGLGVEAHQLFLFSTEGLKLEDKMVDDKIEDIFKLCDKETKQILLVIIQALVHLRSTSS